MFWIFVLITFLQRLSVIDAACSNPIPLSAGIWKTSNRGTWTIPAARTSIQNFRVKFSSTSASILTMNCEDDSSDADGYILFKSTTTVTIPVNPSYVYACIKFEQAPSSTGKYYFYLGGSLTTLTDSSSGKINIYERISILPTPVPYLFSSQCTEKSTSGERAHVAIKDGSDSSSAETCPTGIQGTFSYSGTTCSSQFLDVCSTLTEFNFNYTVCADPQFFSASGQLYCVHSTSSGGYNYLTLYNTDTSPDSSTYFQYVCLVYSTSDLTVRVSINPSECYDSTLHTPTLNSHESGITQTLTNYGDSVCYHPETSTDLTWLYILIAVIVVVVIIVIIIIIICILKRKKKKKPDEESIKSSESEDEEEDVKQDDEKSTHSQQQQDQEQQQEEKEVDDDGRPIVVKEYDRTSIDSGIQQDKKEEKGDEGSSDEKTDEKQTNKNIGDESEEEEQKKNEENKYEDLKEKENNDSSSEQNTQDMEDEEKGSIIDQQKEENDEKNKTDNQITKDVQKEENDETPDDRLNEDSGSDDKSIKEESDKKNDDKTTEEANTEPEDTTEDKQSNKEDTTEKDKVDEKEKDETKDDKIDKKEQNESQNEQNDKEEQKETQNDNIDENKAVDENHKTTDDNQGGNEKENERKTENNDKPENTKDESKQELDAPKGVIVYENKDNSVKEDNDNKRHSQTRTHDDDHKEQSKEKPKYPPTEKKINVKEQEKSARDSEEENEEEEDENESRKSDDDQTGESRTKSDGEDSVDEIERNIHKIGMKKKNDYQPQGELSKVLVSREMEEKMRTKNQEGKWSKMKKLFRKKTKKVKDIDQQKNKEKEEGDDALPSDLDDDDKLPRERNVAPFLAEYQYKKKMDERFEQDHEREEIQLRKQIYTESDDEDFGDIFDESDEGDDEDDGFDEKDAQKRKELDKNLKNQEKQQNHFDENNKYKSDDESREKDKRHGIDRDMTDDELLREKQIINYLNRKQVPGDSDDENLTEEEKKKRKQRKDEQAKDSGVDSPDYKREKSDIPFISENEDEEGDEDIDLPPGYIRDSSGQIIRIEDGKAMSDIEMHQVRKFAKLGVIFNVPRLKRTSSGRPTGEYIVDPFGPKIDPTIQINGDTRGDHSKAKHPRPSKDKRGFGRGSFDNGTRQWSSDGKRQRSGDVGRQRSGDVGRQRSGDVGRGRVDDGRQRTDEEQKKSDDVGRQRVDDGGRQRFVDGRRQRVDDGGRLRVDDVIRQRSVVFDIDGRSDISDVSTLSSLSTGKDPTFENRELLKKRLFKNRRKRGFDNRLYQSEDGPPRELNDLVRVVPQTTNQRLANGRVPLPGTVISRNDSLRNKYDPEQQQMYREGLETDKRFLKESPLMHRRPPGAPREAFMNGEDADDIHVVMENDENEERQRQMEEGVNIGSGDEFFLIGSKQEKQEPLFTYIRGPNQVITRAHPSYGDSLHRNHDLRHTFPWSLLYKNPVRESSIIDINMADRRNAPKSADDIARREIDDKRLKELLEELYTDKKYFDHVIQSTDPNPEPIIDERDLAEHGRDFLLERAEYWDERGVRIPRPPQTALGLRMSRLLTNHPDSGRVSNISYASTVTPTPHPFQASDSQEQVETKEAFVRREHNVS